MKLKLSKCKVIHFDKKNNRPLEESKIERVLGIMVLNELKWACQINHAVSKANRSLPILIGIFTNIDVRSLKRVY